MALAAGSTCTNLVRAGQQSWQASQSAHHSSSALASRRTTLSELNKSRSLTAAQLPSAWIAYLNPSTCSGQTLSTHWAESWELLNGSTCLLLQVQPWQDVAGQLGRIYV